MSFDLERAKKEGCIFIHGAERRPARIVATDVDRVDGASIGVYVRMSHGEVAAFFKPDGTYKEGNYLENKPQRIEVHIYEKVFPEPNLNMEDSGYYAATSRQIKSFSEDKHFRLIKTITVEL